MSERKQDPRAAASAASKPAMPAPPTAPRAVFSATAGGAAAAAHLRPSRESPGREADAKAVKVPAHSASVTPLKTAGAPAPAKEVPVTVKKSKPKAKAKAKPKAKRAAGAKIPFGAQPWTGRVNGEALVSLSEAASDGFRAAAEAGEMFMKNAEKLGKEWTAFADGELEAGARAVRDLSTCRSVEALVAMQSVLAKARLGRIAAHTEKMQQLSLSIAKESFAPIEARFDAAAKRFLRTLTP